MIAAVLFTALVVLGLGMLSYFTDSDILNVPGLGQFPGILGTGLAILALVATLAPVVRPARPAFLPVLLVGIAAALAHLLGVWVIALLGGSGLAHATAAASELVLGGATPVVGLAALLSAWIAVALRRTGAQGAHWPWE